MATTPPPPETTASETTGPESTGPESNAPKTAAARQLKAAARAAAKTGPAKTRPAKTGAKTPGARAAAKPARKAAAAKAATGVDGAAPGAAQTDLSLRLKALVDGITETSGVKKKDVKTVVEAALAQIGAALARGATVNLPGLGHLRVARKATPDSPSMTLKLRQGEAGKAKGKAAPADEKQPLAEDSDQG